VKALVRGKKKASTKKVGRPSNFSQKTADAICERIAKGESLRTICEDSAMPAASSVYKWLGEHEEFAEQYARAREEQADLYASEIVAIADEEVTMVRRSKHQHGAKPEDDSDENDIEVVFDSAAVARNRLRVDARKWYASKLAPKKYGEKVAIGGADDLPPVQTKHSLSDDALAAIAAGALKK
jgi:hypothetical protein